MIRSAEPGELTALAEIYHAAWHWAFSRHLAPENLARVSLKDFEDRWHGIFGNPHTRSFVYEQSGVRVGFISCSIETARPAEILSLMVLPAFHRSGIGGKLITEALRNLQACECSRAVLWVVNENSNARRFYERFGFMQTERKRYIRRYDAELCQVQYEKTLQTDAAG